MTFPRWWFGVRFTVGVNRARVSNSITCAIDIFQSARSTLEARFTRRQRERTGSTPTTPLRGVFVLSF